MEPSGGDGFGALHHEFSVAHGRCGFRGEYVGYFDGMAGDDVPLSGKKILGGCIAVAPCDSGLSFGLYLHGFAGLLRLGAAHFAGDFWLAISAGLLVSRCEIPRRGDRHVDFSALPLRLFVGAGVISGAVGDYP